MRGIVTGKKKGKNIDSPSPASGKKASGQPSPSLERVWSGQVANPGGARADKYIAEIAGILTRSQLKARGARIFVNGKEEKVSRRLLAGESLEVRWNDEPDHGLAPEKLEVRLLYEDKNVFVFDKAQGMVTHPANGNWSGTLANAALWYDAERNGQGAAPRGGIVHRLDKDTSGVIIVARNSETHEYLAAQFKNRTTRKEYWAILCPGPAMDEGHIENYLARDKYNRKKFAGNDLAGKKAITEYRVLSRWIVDGQRAYALVALYPKTGRTHQLRVHMAGIGCPILGDPLYGKKDGLFPEATLMLHARRLKIALPGIAEPKLFKAAVPDRFRAIVAMLEKIGHRA